MSGVTPLETVLVIHGGQTALYSVEHNKFQVSGNRCGINYGSIILRFWRVLILFPKRGIKTKFIMVWELTGGQCMHLRIWSLQLGGWLEYTCMLLKVLHHKPQFYCQGGFPVYLSCAGNTSGVLGSHFSRFPLDFFRCLHQSHKFPGSESPQVSNIRLRLRQPLRVMTRNLRQ